MFASVRKILSQAAEHCALQILESKRYLDAVDTALTATSRWHERECPLKAPLVVWLVLAGSLYRARSQASILASLLTQYRHKFPGLSNRAITPEAVCKARNRLGPEPLARLFSILAGAVTNSACCFGLRPWSIDGTFLTVPDTVANEERFGRKASSRGRTAYPQLHLTSLVSCTTREVRDAVVTPSRWVDERQDALYLVRGLGKGDVVFLDCGFAATWLFRACRDRDIHFVARISNSWKPVITRTLAPGDYVVRIHPKRTRWVGSRVPDDPTLTLRMLVYQVGKDQPVRLLTSLTDPERQPARDVALSYHKRWEVETAHDEQKVHLLALQHGKQKTSLRSTSPARVTQEVYGMLVAYNLVRGLMVESAATVQADPRDLSFVESLNVLEQVNHLYLAARTEGAMDAIRRQALMDLAQTLNPRPRRPRQYERVVKIKMSNYRCKSNTPTAGRHRDFADELTTKALVPRHLSSMVNTFTSALGSLTLPHAMSLAFATAVLLGGVSGIDGNP